MIIYIHYHYQLRNIDVKKGFDTSYQGGGNKSQLYDEGNGEYCWNKQCVEDEKNLVLKILFGF